MDICRWRFSPLSEALSFLEPGRDQTAPFSKPRNFWERELTGRYLFTMDQPLKITRLLNLWATEQEKVDPTGAFRICRPAADLGNTGSAGIGAAGASSAWCTLEQASERRSRSLADLSPGRRVGSDRGLAGDKAARGGCRSKAHHRLAMGEGKLALASRIALRPIRQRGQA